MDQRTSLPVAAAAAAEGRHIPALDGLRGLAILHVMLGHFCMNAKLGDTLKWKLAANAIAILPNGVELFFVLSGFLITGILLDARNRQSYFKSFYGRRAVRIFPLYYGLLAAFFGTLAILIALGRVKNTEYLNVFHRQGWLWSYLANFWCGLTNDMTGTRDIWFGHFWSLALEEQFYLVWPLVIFFCKPRTVASLCIAGLLVTAAARCVLVAHHQKQILFYILRPDGLFAGGLLACLIRIGFEPQRYQRGAWIVLVAAAIATPLFNATVLVASLVPRSAYLLAAMRDFAPMHAVPLFWALMLLGLGAPADSQVRRILEHRWLRFFGKISYGLYVYHDFILPLLLRYLLHAGLARFIHSPLIVPLFGIAATGVCVGIAFASWHLFEKRFLRLKRYFPYRERTHVTSSLGL